MENFSYYWFFWMFLLQVVSLGFSIGRIGSTRTTEYNGRLFLLYLTITTGTGMAMYWWK
jgi:hypothetical protein